MSKLKDLLRPLYVPIANALRAPKRYRYLFRAIKEVQAIRIAEIGTWNGERAMRMIDTAQHASPGQRIEYYGFDLFEGMTDEIFAKEVSKRPPAQAVVEKKLAQTGADIHLYKGDTKQTLPQALSSLPHMDFVFIDGGHHIDTIRSDWNAVSKLMHDRTIVIFDDYWRNRSDAGCKAIIDGLDGNTYDVRVLPIVDSFDTDEFGRLEISFARVTLRPRA